MSDRSQPIAGKRKRVTAEAASPGATLGDWIRVSRMQQSMSQRELADRSGLSRSYLCDIERGRGAQPSVQTLDKLAAALGITGEHDGLDVFDPRSPIRLLAPTQQGRPARLLATPRIGITRAVERRWRFVDADSRWRGPIPQASS